MGLPSGMTPQKEDLQSYLTGSHADFWEQNLSTGNIQCECSEVGQGAATGSVRLEGTKGRVGGEEGKEVTGAERAGPCGGHRLFLSEVGAMEDSGQKRDKT